MMKVTAVVDFTDELATFMETIPFLGLVKGTNFFREAYWELPEVPPDSFAIFNSGYTVLQGHNYDLLDWTIKFAAVRDRRDLAISSLQPLTNAIGKEGQFSLASFAVKSFTVGTAPEVAGELDNNRFLGQMELVFKVIPT